MRAVEISLLAAFAITASGKTFDHYMSSAVVFVPEQHWAFEVAPHYNKFRQFSFEVAP
ncbi:hypothetical protein TorRG33x02_223850 [Trema orientale]|uniref:Uncharacterized protein n=1 Tax=Trema orientale TaxID=63057 RepID=A0A2P5E8K1_TREOI|nr:hypothetical protein TorRG33x02_223850 [Trema orientale]